MGHYFEKKSYKKTGTKNYKSRENSLQLSIIIGRYAASYVVEKLIPVVFRRLSFALSCIHFIHVS